MTDSRDPGAGVESERAAFEAWFCEGGEYEPEWLDTSGASHALYMNADTENMWQAWQARASLPAAPSVAVEGAVEVCSECDIAGCRHIRERRALAFPQPNAAPAERTCNNDECGWHGASDRMLGSIGPLCPKCGETTEPSAAAGDGQSSYSDSTPHLHIGDSAFEDWYQNYLPNSVGHKQIARDAYAAGMGDPLVIAAPSTATAAREQKVTADGLPFGIIDPDYARYYTLIRTTAWQCGYAIGLHGSFTRDLDLIAVPWTEQAMPPELFIKQIEYRTDLKRQEPEGREKPHGRLCWSLLLPGFNDPRWVDLSVMPAIASAAQPQGDRNA